MSVAIERGKEGYAKRTNPILKRGDIMARKMKGITQVSYSSDPNTLIEMVTPDPSRPYRQHNTDWLKMKLNDMIQEERFEECILIRDELNIRMPPG